MFLEEEQEESVFSIFNQDEYTNTDVTVKITPTETTRNYSYQIFKNDKLYNTKNISSNSPININLTETGHYYIEVTLTDSYDNETVYKSGFYNIDKELPVIKIEKNKITIKEGTKYDLLENVTATDKISGDLTDQIKVEQNDFDYNKIGNNKIVYTVSDNAGNTATKSMIIEVLPKENYYRYYLTEGAILGFLLIVMFILSYYRKSVWKEKRITKYSIKSNYENNESLFEKAISVDNRLIKKISKVLSQSEIARNNSKKYEKYVDVFGYGKKSAIDLIAHKVAIGIIFVLIALITKIIRLEKINELELLIPFIVGFFVTNIYYRYRYYNYRKKIENNLLQAITLMNNAFKSGRNITQAVDIVAEELDGPIANEFKRMGLEISIGLDIEEVFKRFSDRIKLEEAVYLTSALSILNKTGGNLIKVFTSIEKTLYNRKKLKLEMKSLTSSSQIIMYTLMILPVLFILIITMIYPSYFTPLFSSILGFVIIAVIMIIYALYIYVVRKIINIRM